MDMFSLFWDLHQQGRLDRHDGAIEGVTENLSVHQAEINALRSECTHLRYTCHALAQLLAQKGILTEQELADGMERTRMEVQRLTGKLSCPGCGRFLKPLAGRCMYCGTALAP